MRRVTEPCASTVQAIGPGSNRRHGAQQLDGPARHFGNGRVRAGIIVDADNGAFNFGTNSFSAEAWIKTGPLLSAYTLVGKGRDDFYYYYSDFGLKVLAGGGVRATVVSANKAQWQVDMVPRTYNPATGRWDVTITDNRWHHLAMVCDRTANKLSIYVDGLEKGSTPLPANFGAMQSYGNPLRRGQHAYYDGWGGGTVEFPGVIDEVRVVNYARTAAQMYDVFYGTTTAGSGPNVLTPAAAVPTPTQPKITVNTVTPGLVARDKAAQQASVTNITIDGANLSGVTARIMRDGQPLDGVVATVSDSSDAQAHLAVAVAPPTPLGLAVLILSKPGFADVAAELRVIEQSEFALEPDTVGLWHLDEREEGVAHLLDASEQAINLTSGPSSRIAEGRFGGGRILTRATADVSSQALALGASSFTVEGWVKTPALGRDYVLIGKETNTGQNTDFTLKAVSSGALRAELYDASGVVWQGETQPGVVNLSDGWVALVAMVVDRENGILSLYVDGQIRVAIPARWDSGHAQSGPAARIRLLRRRLDVNQRTGRVPRRA